jgi:hypothetical protein
MTLTPGLLRTADDVRGRAVSGWTDVSPDEVEDLRWFREIEVRAGPGVPMARWRTRRAGESRLVRRRGGGFRSMLPPDVPPDVRVSDTLWWTWVMPVISWLPTAWLREATGEDRRRVLERIRRGECGWEVRWRLYLLAGDHALARLREEGYAVRGPLRDRRWSSAARPDAMAHVAPATGLLPLRGAEEAWWLGVFAGLLDREVPVRVCAGCGKDLGYRGQDPRRAATCSPRCRKRMILKRQRRGVLTDAAPAEVFPAGYWTPPDDAWWLVAEGVANVERWRHWPGFAGLEVRQMAREDGLGWDVLVRWPEGALVG